MGRPAQPTNQSAHWRGLIVATLLVIAGVFLLPRVMPPPELNENRLLAQAPAWPRSARDLSPFKYGLEAYVADQFPPRAQLIGGLNLLRLWAGSSGSGRVIVGRDGWLFYDDASHLGPARGAPPLTRRQATDALLSLAGRREALAGRGVAYVVLAAPVKEVIYPEKAPHWFLPGPDRATTTLARMVETSGAGSLIYPIASLSLQASWGRKVYSRHDTHWTGLGAYEGYAALMRELQALGVAEEPRSLESFTEDHTRDLYKPRDLALMLGVAGFSRIDYPEMGDPVSERTLKVTYLSDRRDWAAPRVIDTGMTGKPVLLLMRDSFAIALTPFLYSHFSRIILVHHENGAWREDLMARFAPDVVVTEVVEPGILAALKGGPPPAPATASRILASVSETWREPRSGISEPSRARAVRGTDRDDRLDGHEHADIIQSGPGDDRVNGHGGGDWIRGGRGRDWLDGGPGDDWISGDRDDDVLRGGAGADAFAFGAEFGLDEIVDFSIADGDWIELSKDVTPTVRQVGSDTVVQIGEARLIVRGLILADAPPDWIGTR